MKNQLEAQQLEIKQLSSELDTLKDYAENKAKTDAMIDRLAADLEATKEENVAWRRQLEDKHLREVQRIKQQFDATKKDIAEEADARALKNLTSADRRRIDENKKLIKNMNM